MTEWGPWAHETPMTELEVPVTPETARMMRPRLYRLRSGLWEAQPAMYRNHAGLSSWDTSCRISAWARPLEGDELWVALTYLTSCYLQPAQYQAPTHTNPRWRTAWMVADNKLLRPAELPRRYPSEYWQQQLSEALAEFAASIGVTG